MYLRRHLREFALHDRPSQNFFNKMIVVSSGPDIGISDGYRLARKMYLAEDLTTLSHSG